MTTQEFIERARKVHGDKYDYSKVEYVNNRTKVCIICPEHGEFWQRPTVHLRGSSCKLCGYVSSKEKQRKTNDEFLSEINAKYGDKYDYSKVNYINDLTKVCIICHKEDEFGEEHGEFLVTPNNFLKNRECPKCKKRNKLTKDFFLKKSSLVHSNKYDYSKSEVNGVDNLVKIICPEHGEFWQTPYKHMHGQGCPKCGKIKRGLSKRNNKEDVINMAKKVHGDKYNYDKFVYNGIDTKSCIICPEHGEFWQTPYVHVNMRCGCPVCNESRLERDVRIILDDEKIKYKYRYHNKWLGRLELDFYLPDYNIAIECQGIQHFEPTNFGSNDEKYINDEFEKILLRDNLKNKKCFENHVELIFYSNLDINYPYQVITSKQELLNVIYEKSKLFKSI